MVIHLFLPSFISRNEEIVTACVSGTGIVTIEICYGGWWALLRVKGKGFSRMT